MNTSRGLPVTVTDTSPLLKFKSAVLTVIDNLSWLNNDELRRTPIDFFDMKSDVILKESSDLTAFHKLIFFKPPNERTRFELESIEWMFAVGFTFFDSYPVETKMALVRHAAYKCYGPGRWILKAGRLTENMYTIVEGRVRITETEYDCVSNAAETVERCELHARRSFGESATMFDVLRTTSAQSLSTVELISISKKDFANIVADGLRIKWDTNAMAIRNSPYFRHLTDIELHKCSAVSFIKTYTENDHVLGGGLGDRDHGHFVIEGKVSLTYRLRAIVSGKRGDGVSSYKSTNAPKKRPRRQERMVDRQTDPCIFLSDSCFNIGKRKRSVRGATRHEWFGKFDTKIRVRVLTKPKRDLFHVAFNLHSRRNTVEFCGFLTFLLPGKRFRRSVREPQKRSIKSALRVTRVVRSVGLERGSVSASRPKNVLP